MSDICKKIREFYFAETGMRLNVVLAYDGTSIPWIGTIGTYNARGRSVDEVLAAIADQQRASLAVKRSQHRDALAGIESALAE